MYGIIIDGSFLHSTSHDKQEDAESVAESVLLDRENNTQAEVFKIVKTMKKVTTIITEGE